MPADTAVSGLVERLFLFEDSTWVAASTEDDRILLWHLEPDRVWSGPTIFQMRELRLDHLTRMDLAPDGKRMRLQNSEAATILSFDPDDLLAIAYRLLSGRVH